MGAGGGKRGEGDVAPGADVCGVSGRRRAAGLRRDSLDAQPAHRTPAGAAAGGAGDLALPGERGRGGAAVPRAGAAVAAQRGLGNHARGAVGRRGVFADKGGRFRGGDDPAGSGRRVGGQPPALSPAFVAVGSPLLAGMAGGDHAGADRYDVARILRLQTRGVLQRPVVDLRIQARRPALPSRLGRRGGGGGSHRTRPVAAPATSADEAAGAGGSGNGGGDRGGRTGLRGSIGDAGGQGRDPQSDPPQLFDVWSGGTQLGGDGRPRRRSARGRGAGVGVSRAVRRSRGLDGLLRGDTGADSALPRPRAFAVQAWRVGARGVAGIFARGQRPQEPAADPGAGGARGLHLRRVGAGRSTGAAGGAAGGVRRVVGEQTHARKRVLARILHP